MLQPGDSVRVLRKTIGREFSICDLSERFGEEMMGVVREVRFGGVVVVDSPLNGEDYRFAVNDLQKLNKDKPMGCCENDGLVSLTVGQKLLLSADSKALIRAGYVDAGSSELTSKGRRVLEAVIFEANRETLVARANEQIAEVEAKKK